MTSEQLLAVAVKAAEDKRAEDIVALDLQKVSLMADYFVIMDANSTRQVQAIVDEILDQEEAAGATVKRVEGKDAAQWVLIDLGDVIVHVFQKDQRAFYKLEKLWSEAPLVDLSQWVEA